MKSKLLAIDYGTKNGDYTCKVYGRYFKNGKVIIDRIVQYEDKKIFTPHRWWYR